MSFFQGHIESRCRETIHPDMVTKTWAIDPHNKLPCGSLQCPIGTYCGNPTDYGLQTDHNEFHHNEDLLFGYNTFDNIQQSLFSVYNFLMIIGWIQTNQMYWRAQEKWISGIYFVSLVLFLSQIFSNIILATMYEGFLDVTSIKSGNIMERNKKKLKSFKMNSLKRMDNPKYYESEGDQGSELKKDDFNYNDQNQNIISEKIKNEQSVQSKEVSNQYKEQNISVIRSNSQQSNNFVKSFTKNTKESKPPTFSQIILKDLRESKLLKFIFLINIILSAVVLCLDQQIIIYFLLIIFKNIFYIRYLISDEAYIILNQIDFTTIIVLIVEVLLMIISKGFKNYFKENLNKIDVIVVIIHIVSYIIEARNGQSIFSPQNQLYIFVRCTKILRFYKILYHYELFASMKVLLNTYYLTLKSIPEYFFVFVILIVLISQIGRELFAYIQPHSDHEVLRISFNNVQESIIAVIMIFYNEEWHVTMYKYMRYVGYKSVIFHLFSMLICQVLFIRLFIAIFISKFMKWLHIQEKEFQEKIHEINTIQSIAIRVCKSTFNIFCCCFSQKNKQQIQPISSEGQIKHQQSLKIENLDDKFSENKFVVNDQDKKENAQIAGNKQNKDDGLFYESGQKNYQDLKKRPPTLQGIRGSQYFNPGLINQISIQSSDTITFNKNAQNSFQKINNNQFIHSIKSIQQFGEPSPLNGGMETIPTERNIMNINQSNNQQIHNINSSLEKDNIQQIMSPKLSSKPLNIDDYISPKEDNMQIQDIFQNYQIGNNKQQQSDQVIKLDQLNLNQKNFSIMSQMLSQQDVQQKPSTNQLTSTKITSRTSNQFLLLDEKDEKVKSSYTMNELNNDKSQYYNFGNGKIEIQGNQQNYNQNTIPFQSNEIIFKNKQKFGSNMMIIDKNYKDPKEIKSLNLPEHFNDQEYQKQNSYNTQQDSNKDNSFFIFSQKNMIRVSCIRIVNSVCFDLLMSLSIILLALVLVWDSPFIDNESDEKKTINNILLILSIVYVLDNIIQAIAHGFIFNGPQSYFQRNLINILNFITTIACLIYAADFSKKVNYFSKYFAIFRIIILLSFLTKYMKQVEFSGKLIMYCGPRMFKLIIFGMIYLIMNAIVVTKLLKGSSWKCLIYNDVNHTLKISTRIDCYDLGGDWIESRYNFNSIIHSLEVLFLVQSSEGWLNIMTDTFDSTSSELPPQYRQVSVWVIFYIQFFFIANICILNMFVGVVVESYSELFEKETKIEGLNKQQKEWYFIKKSIYNLIPTNMIKRPTNLIRRFIFDNMIKGMKLKVFFYFFTILNCISFMTYKNRISDNHLNALKIINLVCLVVMFIEIVVRILLFKKLYLKSFWNMFDIIALTLGSINLYFWFNEEITIFSSSYRILDGIAKGFQLLRFYRLLKNFVLIRKLFKSLHYAVSSISGIFLVLIIFLYTSVTLSLNLFPYLKEQSTINNYDINFRSFSQALYTLIRIVTSEFWYNIPLEASTMQGPNFVCREDMYDYSDFVKYGYNSCGQIVSYLFFYVFYLILTLIILNIFIATIIESYKQAFSADESAINHYQFDDILNLWKEFDQEGKGYISYKEFWQFSSRIAIIYGVDSKELLDIENKGQFLKTLNIPIFEDPINKIFCYKFHDVIVKLSKISVQIKYGVYKLEHENLLKREELDKTIKARNIKGQELIKPTPLTSSDMVLIIVLTRKVKQWKRKFIQKEENKIAQKLQSSQQQINLEDLEEESGSQKQNEEKQIKSFEIINKHIELPGSSRRQQSEKVLEYKSEKKQKSMNFLTVPNQTFLSVNNRTKSIKY